MRRDEKRAPLKTPAWEATKMIDGSEKRKRQLGFELQNSRVFEKRSKRMGSHIVRI